MLTRRSFVASLPAVPMAAAARLPNIVFILADDLGQGDLGCYNPDSKIPTPNLDRLAASGIRFTDAHTPSSVCTPTRYGLLTGRYCWRTSLTSGVQDGFDPPLIEPGRMTIASMLKSRGYSTACFGKWHLGMGWTRKDGAPMPKREQGGFRAGFDVDYSRPVTGGPLSAGFDTYHGISASLDMPPYCFIENRSTVGIPSERFPDDKTLFMNQPEGARAPGFEYEHVIPALTSKACDYIAKRKGSANPYFIYMPLSSPHLPVVPNKEFRGKSKAGLYGDFVVEMDAAVGKVLGAIRAAGHEKDTLVIFSSDNGGLWHSWDAQEADDKLGKPTPRGKYTRDFGHQSNSWMRGTKADLWEGGHRVPLIARWPGQVTPGAVSASPVCLTDWMATCAEIVGQPLPRDAGEDSFSMFAALRDPSRPVRDHVISHSVQGRFAIRQGKWKLMPERGSGGFSLPRQVTPGEGEPAGQFYDLESDRRETRNLWSKHPNVVARLTALLDRARMSGRTR